MKNYTIAEVAALSVEERAAYNYVTVEKQIALDALAARGINKYSHEFEIELAKLLGVSPETETERQAREAAADARLAKGESDLHAARLASQKT